MTTEQQAPSLEWTPPEDIEVGRLIDVPIRTQSAMIVVRCDVLEQRVVYGRVEYLVTPVEGSGETWVQEASFRPDGGARVVGESERTRSRPGKPRMPKSVAVEDNLDDRIRKALEA